MENNITKSNFFLAVLSLGVVTLYDKHDWYVNFFVIYYFFLTIISAIIELKQK